MSISPFRAAQSIHGARPSNADEARRRHRWLFTKGAIAPLPLTVRWPCLPLRRPRRTISERLWRTLHLLFGWGAGLRGLLILLLRGLWGRGIRERLRAASIFLSAHDVELQRKRHGCPLNQQRKCSAFHVHNPAASTRSLAIAKSSAILLGQPQAKADGMTHGQQ